jgi:hypothetical protein
MSYRIFGPVSLEFGGYALAEDSILWYPDSPHRTISVFALRGGLKIKVAELASLNLRYYAYRNSDQVNASTLAAGVIFNPGHPLAITVYYYRYTESAQYRFSGDYFSAGLSLYY